MQSLSNLLSASFSAKMVSSGYTFLSSQILKILSMDLETDGSLEEKSSLPPGRRTLVQGFPHSTSQDNLTRTTLECKLKPSSCPPWPTPQTGGCSNRTL